MTKEEKDQIITKYSPLIKSYSGYMRDLFDWHQTHAIYGCDNEALRELKLILKKLGANKFRIVKNKGYPILCFNASKMNLIQLPK